MWSNLQPRITRTVLLPLWAALTRSSYLRELREFRQAQREPRPQVEARQLDRLKKLLIHAYTTTAYYHRVFDEVGFSPSVFNGYSDLSKIPVLTKDLVRKHFDELISSAYPKNRLKKNATGGSTGVPLTIFVTPERETAQGAAIALNYEWVGLKSGDRLAMLWGSAFDATRSAALRGKIENTLLGRLLLPTFVLSDEILARYAASIRRFKPKALLGYTSSLRAFASYLERSGEQVPKLTSVISGAETLYDHDRAFFEKVFSCPVFNRYGGRDSGAVAAECSEQHHLHMNEEVVYAEVTAQNEIAVTDLWNYGMPFIRYLPEDIGTLSKTFCACGRTSRYFASIEGRVNDILMKPNGELVPGEFFPHLFKDVRGIRQYQVVQSTRSRIDISIVRDGDGFDERQANDIRQRIIEYFGPVEVLMHDVETIPIPASGKFRFTICTIPRS